MNENFLLYFFIVFFLRLRPSAVAYGSNFIVVFTVGELGFIDAQNVQVLYKSFRIS